MAGYTSVALGALFLISCVAWGSATVYTVGDTSGWTSGVDYSTWTSGKSFAVGDSLAFNYASGAHTVTEVSSSDYDSCSSSNAISNDSNGPTTIQLKTPGTHYFICAIPGHCSGGMKLAVTVGGSSSGSPTTPSPPSTSTTPTLTPPTTTTTGTRRSGAGGLAPASAMVALTGLAVLLF
ncbi:blue copper protein-like [Phoenix dactylifera]|uniref:Blue copper protein-like n=1 Tax=Phoenix dactylifera TaxID=42345 RepID=A0A8B7CTB7_PHODC|nr:blue copper protein-like [Phoenix dactylifera]